jgi:hypothetical protein
MVEDLKGTSADKSSYSDQGCCDHGQFGIRQMPKARKKDIAKYFVPPSTIRGFIPTHDCPRRLGYFSWRISDAAREADHPSVVPPSIRQPRSYPIVFSRQQAIDYVESDAVPVELRATKHSG